MEGFSSLLPLALLLGRRPAASAQLAAAVFEFPVLRDGKLGGVGGGDAIADLHAVALLHLRQRAHQPRVGRVQGHDPLLLQQTAPQSQSSFANATPLPHKPAFWGASRAATASSGGF